MSTTTVQTLRVALEHEEPPPQTRSPKVSKWAVLFASFSVMFVAVGMPNSFGIFQNYYETVLFPEKASSEIILIGSMASSLYMILGAFTGRLADIFGYDLALLVGSALIVGSLFAASAASEFYQYMLCQGLTFGLGTAFVYYPAVSVSQRLFTRHGLANGFVVSGAALGGCVLPYSTRLLLTTYGLSTAFRVLGYVAAGMLVPASLVFVYAKRHLKHATRSPARRKMMDFSLLRDSRFNVMVVATTVALTGFLPRYFLITPSAISRGIDATYASWLIGLMNGVSIIGRMGIGAFADRYGKLTALIVSFVVSGSCHLVFWLPAVLVNPADEKATALMTVFVVVVGLLGSGFVALIPVVMAEIFGAEELASKVGLMNSITGLGVLAGPSIVYAIVASGQDWAVAILLPGLLMIFGGIMLVRTFKYL